jgi:methylated-DNA-protein-cysteine methyltransferase related protein
VDTVYTSHRDPKAFNALVWEIVRQIPPGMVSTYGRIAAMIPPPEGMNLRSYEAFGARWVGGAMAACPEGVPWQRVINSQGKISFRPGGYDQRRLLEGEGVVFDEKGRVNLKRYGWNGPSREWLTEHGLPPLPEQPTPIQTEMKF